MTTMYEVNWHYVEDKFSHVTVTPITVTWRGLQPGATLETLRFKDADGTECIAGVECFYETEAKAWEAARLELAEAIQSVEADMELMRSNARSMGNYLQDIS